MAVTALRAHSFVFESFVMAIIFALASHSTPLNKLA